MRRGLLRLHLVHKVGLLQPCLVAERTQKIGKTVFLWINMTITTVGTATGDCNIGGLPFSASQAGAGTGINSGNVVITVRQNSGTSALFANATNGGSAMANSTSYEISINYFV